MYKLPCNIVLCVVLLLSSVVCVLADDQVKESAIAGVSIGKTVEEVCQEIATLQHVSKVDPSGRMTAQPPIEQRSSDSAAATGSPAAPTPAAPSSPAPNTLIFTNFLTSEEVSIGSSTIVYAESSAQPVTGSPSMTGGAVPPPMSVTPAPMPTSSPMNPSGGSGSGSDASSVTLPVWAYLVRANTLRLNQEQLIFRVGKVAAIGVTFTKANGAFAASDIIMASLEPLAEGGVKSLHFTASIPNDDPKLVIGLGASYASVLNKYGWTPYLYPYATQTASKTTGFNGDDDASLPVSYYVFTRTSAGDTVSPDQEVWDMSATMTTTTMPGDDPVTLTDGKKEKISAGFSNSLLALYPASGIAVTCINNKVVRIQVGTSIVVPPDPPKPATTTASGPAAPVIGPITTPAGPVTPPVKTTNPWDQ